MPLNNGTHGAYLRRELVTFLGKHRVDADLAQGRLRRLWVGVLVEPQRYADPWARSAGALLLHGERAAISGPTAARLHGCDAIESNDVHVTVPYGHCLRTRAGLFVHNAPLPAGDITELDGLRVLTLERTVSDLLCTARAADALAVADQALAAHPPSNQEEFRERLARRLHSRRDRRGILRAIRLLALASGRAESPPESWLRLELDRLGFPPPQVNWSITTQDGVELFRIDLAWPEYRIALEYNGYAVHAGREQQDQRRADELRRRGWIVIVATREDLRDSRELERRLREALRVRRCLTAERSLGRRDRDDPAESSDTASRT
jgi:hypothetical protein